MNDLGAQMLPPVSPLSRGGHPPREPTPHHVPVRQQLGHEDGQSLLSTPFIRTLGRGLEACLPTPAYLNEKQARDSEFWNNHPSSLGLTLMRL